jgi:hypothetical protein
MMILIAAAIDVAEKLLPPIAGAIGFIVALIFMGKKGFKESFENGRKMVEKAKAEKAARERAKAASSAGTAPAEIDSPKPEAEPAAAMATRAEAQAEVSYYLHIDDTVHGPYEVAQIQTFIAEGRITHDTLCCRVGGEAWVPIGML